MPAESYSDSSRISGRFVSLFPKLRAILGVKAVGLVSLPPLSAWNATSRFFVDGSSELGTGPGGDAGYRVISPNYFQVMSIPLRSGREFEDADGPGSPHVAIINEAAARRNWQGESPLGHRIRFPGMDDHRDIWLTIVGVVSDAHERGLDALPTAEIYVSFAQRPERLVGTSTLLVRSAVSSALLAPAVRGVIQAEDPNIPVTISSMVAAIDQSVASRRFVVRSLGAFSLFALFLATIGIYGVLAYCVAQRRREFSVRMVLGARSGQIRGMILLDALRAVFPGGASSASRRHSR